MASPAFSMRQLVQLAATLLAACLLTSSSLTLTIAATGPYGGVDAVAEAAWLAAFPQLPLPATVLLEESPLTPQQASNWSTKLTQSLHFSPQESSQLCSEARLLCTPTPRLRTPLSDDTDYLPGDWIIYSESAPSKDVEPIPPGRFFKVEQLYEGATMIMPNLNHPVSSTPYLPHSLAQHLPITPASIPSFLSLLSLSNSCSMGYVINGIIQRCNKKDDPEGPTVKRCAVSIEDMIGFVVETLGKEVEVLESQPTPKFLNNATSHSMVVKKLDARSNSSTSNVVCHKLLFPSMMRGCHELDSTKVYEAQLQIQGSNLYHGSTKSYNIYAVAVCHFDTSKWNSDHPSFALLDMSPGKGPICHWIRADEHVWLRM